MRAAGGYLDDDVRSGLRADEPTYVEIEFDQGVPCALDGTPMSFLDIIYAMNDIAGTNGYGRIDMVENRLVGVKSRECYEVPAVWPSSRLTRPWRICAWSGACCTTNSPSSRPGPSRCTTACGSRR